VGNHPSSLPQGCYLCISSCSDVTESSEEQIQARLLHICRERVSIILEKRREREAGLKHKDTFIVLGEEVQVEATDLIGRSVCWKYRWLGRWYNMAVGFGVPGVTGLPPHVTEEGLTEETKDSIRLWTASEIRRFSALKYIESITLKS